MSNYDAIKDNNLKDMALLFRHITLCALNKEIGELPTISDWEEYLKGNSVFLPFGKKEQKE